MSLKAPYYYSTLTRNEANEILSGMETGSFLVRKSDGKNNYVLSIMYLDKPIHYQMHKDLKTSLFYLENDNELMFRSLDELCQHHKQNPGILKTKLANPVTSDSSSSENVYSPPPEPIKKRAETMPCNQPLYVNEEDHSVNFQHAEAESSTDKDFCAHEKCDWFHGPISEDEAFERLSKLYKEHSLDGIFLVRSHSDGHFILELINDKRTYKYKLYQNPSTNLFCISDEMQQFATLKEMVDFFRVNNPKSTGLKCNLQLACPNEIESKKKEKKSVKQIISRGKFTKNKGERVVIRPIVYAKIERKHIKLSNEILGKGEFGEVRKGTCKIGSEKKVCAVKILNPKDSQALAYVDVEMQKERDIMRGLEHSNIVKLLGMCEDSKGMLLVLELMVGGSLLNYLRGKNKDSLPEDRIQKILLDMCSGMMYLTKNNIVHRDLAARNVLLGADGCAKISDFGMARIFEKGMYVQIERKKGPLKWYAPECMEQAEYTTKSDVWSFGVTMWETFSYGKTPYQAQPNETLIIFLKAGSRLKQPPDCSDHFYSVMNECWKMQPQDRPSFYSIYDKL